MEKMAGLLFRKKKCHEVRFEWVEKGSLSERKRKVTACSSAEDGKETGTSSGKSGTTEKSGGWEYQK